MNPVPTSVRHDSNVLKTTKGGVEQSIAGKGEGRQNHLAVLHQGKTHMDKAKLLESQLLRLAHDRYVGWLKHILETCLVQGWRTKQPDVSTSQG